MRVTPFVLSALGAAMISAGLTAAQAAEGKFYDPTNTASTKGGKTIGHELYRTIGCPGRQLLDAPCPDGDADGDGVADSKDKCPNTPKGAKVNAEGCELDGDGDGVVDRLDKCPTTPKGRKVNAEGCELDGDGDGVVDALDKCPATPKGRKVNADGCELDSDGDGIVDALDKCPATPKGRKVNADGCELDSDGDGIVDALDKCPAVPAPGTADGCPVVKDSDGDGIMDDKDKCPAVPAPGTPDGCPVAPPPKKLTLEGVNFDNDKVVLRPEAYGILDKAAATLKEWGDVKVEVAGHTDSRSDDDYNLNLSQRRAEAVRSYLISKGVAADRLIAKGYGEANPVADNETEEGRFKNRRVELVPLK